MLAVVALAAALPAVAGAQDAGGNQYQDPLAGEPGGGGGGGGGNSGGGGGGSGNSGGGGTQNVQPESGSGGDTTAAAGPARNQLPATGVDAWLIALAGAMLLGGGLGLRRAADRAAL